jgi:hypothetical protein
VHVGAAGRAGFYVTHPTYREFVRSVGRGVHRVNRIDVALQRP